MQLPVSAVRAHEITDQMWAHVQLIGGEQFIQVHPTFLYESLWNLGVICVLYWYRTRKKFQGELFLTYLLGYGLLDVSGLKVFGRISFRLEEREFRYRRCWQGYSLYSPFA